MTNRTPTRRDRLSAEAARRAQATPSPRLPADFNAVPGGLADMPPNPAAQALGRLGGRANTPAQKAQRRAAAKRAGRPRRVCTRCLQPVVGGHSDRALDASCGAHGWRWERAGVRHEAPKSRDAAALDRIAEWLRAPEPPPGTTRLALIAGLVRGTGRKVGR
jgi:hypothetical protein